jgi:cyclopropane fatty-acyl-phospholipid synthase-like methyltransferase
MKDSQNTLIVELDRLIYPASSTSIDRYVFANHWTKNKTVLDAATGKGYGAGILLSLGAKKVVGIDIDEEGVKSAAERMHSPNCEYITCDIFDLKNKFSENQFEICTSIETFEHLPPERIDEYLSGIKYCTSETVIITTPRRKTKNWDYNGGTHLYEYDLDEMMEILNRNFQESEISGMGLNEIRLPNNQWGTDITTNLNNCWVFFFIIHLNKNG